MKRIAECVVIVAVSIAIALIYNYFSPNGIALVGEWDTEKGVISAGAKNNPVVHGIELDDVDRVKAIFDSGEALFLDARSEEAYNEGHIQGAVCLPLFQFEDRIEPFYETYPATTPLITYCSGRECQDSHDLAQLLMDIGYTQVKVFIDGYPVWLERGFPVSDAAGEGGVIW